MRKDWLFVEIHPENRRVHITVPFPSGYTHEQALRFAHRYFEETDPDIRGAGLECRVETRALTE
jgi:hypothetical protein